MIGIIVLPLRLRRFDTLHLTLYVVRVHLYTSVLLTNSYSNRLWNDKCDTRSMHDWLNVSHSKFQQNSVEQKMRRLILHNGLQFFIKPFCRKNWMNLKMISLALDNQTLHWKQFFTEINWVPHIRRNTNWKLISSSILRRILWSITIG